MQRERVMSTLIKAILIIAYTFIYLPNISSQTLIAEQIYKKVSGAVLTQTNNISYFIQQFCFVQLVFGGLLNITHSTQSYILIHLVNYIRANNLVLLNFSEKINKITKILI